MAKLFGQELTKAELMKRVGNLASLAGVTRIRQEGGRAGNLRSYEVINERMRFSVLADKCMDIGALYYDGMPLFFLAKPGQMNGLWYNDGVNAPRSISGGMMFTCGLNNVGPMQTLEDGRTLPQHGTIRNAPATLDGARCFWNGDDYVMELTGEMREGELFGENLVLRRTITTRLGDPAVHIHDQIENEGSESAPSCSCITATPVSRCSIRIRSSSSTPSGPNAATKSRRTGEGPSPAPCSARPWTAMRSRCSTTS